MARAGQRGQDAAQRTVNAVSNEVAALEYRKRGLTYRRIGIQLGITEEGARYHVMQGLKHLRETGQETAGEVLELELQRLDELWFVAFEKAAKGDAKSIETCLRIQERRARLLGLDAAIRHEIGGPNGGAIPIDLTGLTDDELAVVHRLLKGTEQAQ